MPSHPSGTAVDTIDRLRAANDLPRNFLSPNLLVNPNFHHIDWPVTLASSYGNQPNWLRFAPGWFPLGFPDGADAGVDFPATVVDDSPFGLNCGIEFTTAQDRWGGLIQEIPNASLLRGRRIRISGCFGTLGTEGTSGFGVYLKSQKQQINDNGTTWVAGGLQYLGPQLTSQDEAVLAVYAGSGTAFGAGHPVNIPLFDFPYADAPSYYLKMNGGESSSESGSYTQHSVTSYTFRLGVAGPTGLTGTPATDGSLLLHEEGTSGVAGTYYFESFVDIPDDDDLFEDDTCYIVLLPYRASSVGAMDGPTTCRVYSVGLEIVLDEVDVADRILYGNLSGNLHPLPYGTGTGRLSRDYLLRNPIYVPQVYPLMQGAGRSQTLTTGGLGDQQQRSGYYLVAPAGYGPEVGMARSYVAEAADDFWLLDTPHLPPGGSVLRGSLRVQLNTGDGLDHVKLYEWPAYLPSGDTLLYDDNGKLVVNLLDTSITTVGVEQTLDERARRNRIGLYWNEKTDDTLVNGTLGAAEHVTLINTQSAGDGLLLGAGWLLVAADPRLASTAYSMEP